MAALFTRELFGGQTHGTVLGNTTVATADTSSGSGTLTQHVTSPNVRGGGTALACLAETASKFAVWQKASRSYTGITFIGMMMAAPAATAYVSQIRATTTAVAAELQLTTAGALRMRNLTTAVGTALTLPVGQPFRVDWTIAVSGTTQTLAIYTGNKIDSTKTADAEQSTSGSYTQGTMDYIRIGNIAAVAGGMNFLWTELSADDAAIPAPTFIRAKSSRRHVVGGMNA